MKEVYSVFRRNTQLYYTPKHIIRYLFFFEVAVILCLCFVELHCGCVERGNFDPFFCLALLRAKKSAFKPPLSGHPRVTGEWPLNGDWPLTQ